MSNTIIRKTGLRATFALFLAAGASTAIAMVPDLNSRAPSAASSNQKSSPTQDNPIHAPVTMLERVVNFESDKLATQRDRFIKAEKALKQKHFVTFRKLLPELVEYPLYPYLRYQDIQRRISKASTEELNNFFSEFGSQPVSQLLRSKLLNTMARRGQWEKFLAFYTPQNSRRMECHHAYALIRTGRDDEAYAEIEKLWKTGESLPHNCDRVFNSWKAAGKLTPELAWERFSLALNNGHSTLGRYLVRSLPAKDRKLARIWVKLYRQPDRLHHYQSMLLSSTHLMAPTILNSVIKRLTSRDPQQAAELLEQSELLSHLSEADYYDLAQSLAISLSRQQLPGAEQWFARIPERFISDLGQEWQIRVALRESEWNAALNIMNKLPRSEQESDRWRYWRGRVLYEQGLKTTANALFRQLAQQRSYYGFLAADRLDLPYSIKDNPYQPGADELFAIVQNPGIRRARELLYLDRNVEARREWRYATNSMTNDERIDASKLAQHWGWVGQSILTMASTDSRDDIDLRFPLLMQDKVMAHSERASIDPAWTYGVIRRESAFVPDARSAKGAIGLMQLMPATAKHVSQSIKKISYRNSSQLTQPDTNLALGTHYLNKMLERFDGQSVLATAAYNAGARRVEQWLPKDNNMDAERWIENIPIKETREYVSNVLAYRIIYADRLGMEGQRLSTWMKNVPSKNSALVKQQSNKEQLASLKNEETSLR